MDAIASEPNRVQIFDCEQRSDEWRLLRLGLPTASEFATILRQGKNGDASRDRDLLLRMLAGEIITGVPSENYENKFMQRGIAMEPSAREWYERTRFADLRQIGFMRRGKAGASPDSLVGERGALEIKTVAPHLLIPIILDKRRLFPPEHRAQCQGILWVGELDWIDLVLWYDGMPAVTFHAERDEPYVAMLNEEVDRFELELRRLIEKVRNA